MTTKALHVRKERLLNKETKTGIKIQSATGQPLNGWAHQPRPSAANLNPNQSFSLVKTNFSLNALF